MTLFIPLAGRIKLWPALASFLDTQTLADRCKLYLLDTSGDARFSGTVAAWAANCRYAKVVHHQMCFSDKQALANLPRDSHFAEVNRVMVHIYRLAQTIAEGEYIFIVEDDVLPPPYAYQQLVNNLPLTAFSISGAYPIRGSTAWTAWNNLTTRASIARGQGVAAVKATGFGCLVMRTAIFQAAELSWSPQPKNGRDWPWGYDMEFFAQAQHFCADVLIDWNVICQHLDSR